MKREGIRRILRSKNEVKRSRKTIMAMTSAEEMVDKKSPKANVKKNGVASKVDTWMMNHERQPGEMETLVGVEQVA
jgi:hypothetical protein